MKQANVNGNLFLPPPWKQMLVFEFLRSTYDQLECTVKNDPKLALKNAEKEED